LSHPLASRLVRVVSALLAATAISLCMPVLATAAEPRASLPDIEDEVMCPICGTLLELSDSPQAERERAFIRERIDQGQTKEQIKDALVAEYGDEVLATPSSSGFDLTAWLLPILGLVAALAALVVAALRLSRRRGAGSGSQPQALAPEDAARLERDLSSFEP
jgi:cytochrome c-type biogenesis protein CcmH